MKVRNMSRFWMVLGLSVSMGVTLLWVTPVRAVSLSNTQIDWDTFLTFSTTTPVPGAPPLIDYFDFSPPSAGDGEIYSAVFLGTGPAEGQYVYVYQVYHYETSDSSYFTGLAFKALTTIMPTNIPGVGTSFYIVPDDDDPPIPPIGGTSANAWGNYKPTEVDYTPNPPVSDISVSYVFQDKIPKGGVSYFFGFVHPLPPTKVLSNPKNAAPDVLNPLVYTPSPEPSAFVLIGTGLLGLLVIRRRYFA